MAFPWGAAIAGGATLLGSLFGGKKKTKAAPTQVSVYSPRQQAVMDVLGQRIQEGLERPVPAYPGQMYVPKTPEEQAYLEQVPTLAEQLAEMRSRLGQPAYQITPETTEQYYREAIRAPMEREWREIVEPSIREAYAGPGYWGSARAEAIRRSAENLATELAAKRAELYYADELARRQALEAAAQREATYGLPMTTAEAEMLGTAGQYARMIKEQEELANLQRWLMGETVGGVTPTQYSPFLNLAFSYLGLSPYAYGQTITSSESPNIISALLSGAQVAGALGWKPFA